MRNLARWCYIFAAMIVWIPIVLTLVQGKTMSRWMANRIIAMSLFLLVIGIILNITKNKKTEK